ncbi:hypothetical protein WMO19_09665, partial [Peptoniphilus sp. CLA-SR-H025]
MKAKSKRIMGLFLALVMLLGCLPFNIIETYAAEGDVKIDEINFPDANFRKYVADNFDTDSSKGVLSQEELNAVTKIDVNNKKIVDLKGIEFFKNLVSLSCNSNQITRLDLSQNQKLEYLYCISNQLTELNLSKNPELTHLWCGHNKLAKLDVSKNTALTSLLCNNNQLTELDVSKNTALMSLSCGNNKLTALDVSKNTALTSLTCNSNQLTELDVKNNAKLNTLLCGNNKLTALDVSKNTAFQRIDCSNNQLTVLKLPNTQLFLKELNQKYNISVPKGNSIIDFPKGFDANKIQGTIAGLTVTADGIEWDEKTEVKSFKYKVCESPEEIIDVEVMLNQVANPALEAAEALVEKAETDKTEENYTKAKEAVDALAKGSGKTGLETRLTDLRKSLDELKTAKDAAKEEIKDLNLTPEEKTAADKAIDEATDKAGVDKAVEEAKEKAAANDKKA